MDPFSLLLSISNLMSQWAIAIGVWTIAGVYIYRKR